MQLSLGEPYSYQIDSVIEKMTLEEKIGQLFFIDVSTKWSHAEIDRIETIVKKHKPGGILVMQSEPEAFLNLKARLNQKTKVPLLYAVDGEWGAAMRFDSLIWFPKSMMLGAIRDNRIVREVGAAIGNECRQLGVHINFAPVLDVNNNAQNPVINMRSFGENPQRVAEKGYAYFTGLQSAGVMAVGKHFPGHGDTDMDSHFDLPVIHKSLKELKNNELIPFKRAANFGIEGIMTAHLVVPALDSSLLPVSLSPKGIDYLRNTLDFKGLIFSDALNMRAVHQRFDKHYLKALLAGNDVLLFPADLSKGINEVLWGIENKLVSEQEINAKVRRILAYKYKAMGDSLFGRFNIKNDYISYRKVLQKAIQNAVTLIKNDNNVIPIDASKGKKAMLITIGSPLSDFAEGLSMYRDWDWFTVNVDDPNDMNKVLLKAPDYDNIVLAFAGNGFSVSTNYGFSSSVQNFMYKLPVNKAVSLVLFTNPYALKNVQKELLNRFSAIMIAYEQKPEIESVAAQMVMGGLPAMGVLPVSINKQFPAGTGMYTQKTRLNYSFPETKNLSIDTLNLIDEIVLEAIADEAIPGCQVLVAKNGSVVYNKSFGYHTYKKLNPVKWNDIYDLASVTKVATTVPIIMHLNEFEELSLEQKLGDFNGLCTSEFKKDIKVRELLLHQSGLKPYIPFHYMIIDADKLDEGVFSRKKTGPFTIQVGEGVYANNRAKFKPGFVTRVKDDKHGIKVGPNMFMFNEIHDTISAWIDSSDVDSTRSYRYSDLNFYYLEKVINRTSNLAVDAMADSLFYKPLGMNNTMFLPLQKRNEKTIIPTENDQFFRKSLVRGYVHDQAAAMVGGISGHAGLFSNANDLAKLGQVFLNNGWYGSNRYFEPSTINYFTQTGNQLNRRGLGFDKPEPDTAKVSPACESASLNSYGHSGFTGTFLWVDPDKQLIYVFLSNRVHPNAYNNKLVEDNVRTRIQQKIYNALLP